MSSKKIPALIIFLITQEMLAMLLVMVNVQAFLDRTQVRQNQLAETLGVAPSTLNNWIKGTRDMPSEAIRKLFVMGATVEELFGIDCPCKKLEDQKAPTDTEQILRRLESLERVVHSQGNIKAG